MTIKLYELAAAEDDRRFSPYCWRIRMALAHKGLAVETIPWRFTEKEAIAFSGSGTVPVLVDGRRTAKDDARVVADSWAIAQYLDRNNMAMALKEIKAGPTIEGKTATLTASLQHASLPGPAVTWQFRFEQNPDGTWNAVSHK